MDLYTIRNEIMSGKTIFDLNLNVTFYTRVSSSTDEQLNSLKNQITYFNDFINNIKNWTLYEGYVDEGLSGVSVLKREAFNKMIEDGRNRKFNLVVTKEVSRFARNTLDSIFFTRELLKYDVGVYFQNDNINTLMPDSELRLTIMASMAQEESRKISDRIKWGHKRSIESGKVHGNDRMWGYNKQEGRLVINEKEAEIVREVFQLYCQGYGLRRLSEKLAEKGYINHNGNIFSFTSLKNILTNPKYKGYYCGKKSTTTDYLTRERMFFDRKDWIMYYDPVNVPPIVSGEVWDRANGILGKRGEKMCSEDKTSYQNKFIYSGKILCGLHKKAYWHNNYKYETQGEKQIWQCKIYRKKGKYACDNPHIYKHELDFILKTIINEYFYNKEILINKLMAIYSKYMNETDHDKDIKDLSGKIQIVEQKKEKLLELALGGALTNEEFKKRNNGYNEEINLLNGHIIKLKYNKSYNLKHNNEDTLKLIRNTLEQGTDFEHGYNEGVAGKFIKSIKICKTDVGNIIKLDVLLKTGAAISAFYKKHKEANGNDMHLLHPIHMVRADIETEIAPLVGTEKQSEELVNYLLKEFENEPGKIWESNIFGKSLHELVSEGLHNKLNRMPEDARLKLQETLQKIINEGSGGLICIIL